MVCDQVLDSNQVFAAGEVKTFGDRHGIGRFIAQIHEQLILIRQHGGVADFAPEAGPAGGGIGAIGADQAALRDVTAFGALLEKLEGDRRIAEFCQMARQFHRRDITTYQGNFDDQGIGTDANSILRRCRDRRGSARLADANLRQVGTGCALRGRKFERLGRIGHRCCWSLPACCHCDRGVGVTKLYPFGEQHDRYQDERGDQQVTLDIHQVAVSVGGGARCAQVVARPGTGSCPPAHQGWQRSNRRTANQAPLNGPCALMAWRA